MKVEFIPYTLGTQFACYAEYGDFDDLTDEEKSQFDDLEQSARINAPEGYQFAHWSISTDKHDEFTKCQATDLMGSCYQFDAVYFNIKTDPIIAFHIKTETSGWKEVFRHSFDWLGWDKHDRSMIEHLLNNGSDVVTIGWNMYQLVKEKSK
jgi:hypothetical protein